MVHTNIIIDPISMIDEDTNKSVKIIEIDESEKKPRINRKHLKDGGWGWVIVIGSLISHMLNDGIIYSYGVLAPAYIDHFKISRSTVGWMGSTLVAVTLGTGPLASYLCKRFSYRTVSLAGSIISVIGFGAPYFYNELWFLIASSSVVCGIGFGLVYLPSIIIVNVWFEKKRSLALGIAVCGAGLGTFVFSPLLEALLYSFDWQITMLITAGLLLLLIPCSLVFSNFDDGSNTNCVEKELIPKENIENTIVKNNERSVEENYEEVNVEDSLKENGYCETKTNSMRSYLEILKNPIFLLLLLSNVFSSLGFNAPYMFAKDRAIQSGFTASQGSFLISAIGIGNCIGRVGFGFLATLKTVNRFHLYNSTLIIGGLVLIISWVLNHYILMVTYTIIYGAMIGALVTLTSVILVDLFGMDKLDLTFGICLVFQGISVLLGPPFAGFIFDISHSYNIAFAVCGIFIAISGAMMYLSYISSDFRKKKFQ